MCRKLYGGGGDAVAHSRLSACQGSPPAGAPERRLRTMFTRKSTMLSAIVAAPAVATRLSGPQPVSGK
jgi:hypothetical protein